MEVTVNPHAIVRYRQRRQSSKQDIAIRDKILHMLSSSYEVSLKPQFKATALLNHNFVEAKYFRHKDWILVVRNNEVITLHEGTSKRWTRDPEAEARLEESRRNNPEPEPAKNGPAVIKECLFENPADCSGNWRNWPIFTVFQNGKEFQAVVKVKNPRNFIKFFHKGLPILYVGISKLAGQDPKDKTFTPPWESSEILKIDNGIIFLEDAKIC